MPYKTSPAPHLRAEDTVPGMLWTVVLALLPVAGVRLFLFGFAALRIFSVTTASALVAELFFRKIFGRTSRLYDGSAVITGFLLALILPPALPSWMAALAAFAAIGMGKEIFGGLGQNPFNPALVGAAFLLASFPSVRGSLEAPGMGAWEPVAIGAVFLGGALLLIRRIISWEPPFWYAAGFLLTAGLWGPARMGAPAWSLLFLAAFFLVTDPPTLPLTRLGRRWFAAGAGALGAVLTPWAGPLPAVVHGLLLMNGLGPALDRKFRPRFRG